MRFDNRLFAARKCKCKESTALHAGFGTPGSIGEHFAAAIAIVSLGASRRVDWKASFGTYWI